VRLADEPHAMCSLGQKRTFSEGCAMSALPPKADIGTQPRHVRFVPKADILRCSKECRYSITSSAWARRVAGTLRAIALRLELD
jgi:hypothetical protein